MDARQTLSECCMQRCMSTGPQPPPFQLVIMAPPTSTEPVSMKGVCGVTVPASSAAAMVRILKVEPGSYCPLTAGLAGLVGGNST
jgi:hypothetical protein